MRKTPTIFDRDWDGNRGVVPALLVHPGGALPTEKLDGTNVRLTVRGGEVVRVEKRRNPDKAQKGRGITEPWYVDAASPETDDQYVYEAVANADLSAVPDGEWSAEAVGPKIQGNPLALAAHRLFLFDRDRVAEPLGVPLLADVPTLIQPPSPLEVGIFYDALRHYLETAPSRVNPSVGIEGIVWHGDGWAKIKRKDFK